MDEYTNEKGTTQMTVFVKGVKKVLNEAEELLSRQSIKETTTGADNFTEVIDAFERFGFKLPSLCGIITGSDRSMSGTLDSLVS